MSQDQPFIWKSSWGGRAHKLGGEESLGIYKVGQVDGVSDIPAAYQLFEGRV